MDQANRVAAESLGIARQVIAEFKPGKHLADHDVCLRLHQGQIFSVQAKIDNSLGFSYVIGEPHRPQCVRSTSADDL